MHLNDLLRVMLVGGVCQALLHINPSPAYKIAAASDAVFKTLEARQTTMADPSSCSQPSTAYHVAVECTPFVGILTSVVCRSSSTLTTTGCDVTDHTTTSMTSATITARCDAAVCGGKSCEVSKGTGTKGFPQPTSTPSTSQSQGPSGQHSSFRQGVEKGFPAIPEGQKASEGNSTIEIHRNLLSEDYEESWLYEWSKVDPEIEHRHGAGHVEATWREDGRTSSRIRAFEDQAFNIGVQGLIGCTSVILVSRRGVYMSHIWEHPTFTVDIPEMWDADVMYGLFTGDASGLFPGLSVYTFGIGAMFDPEPENGVDNTLGIFIVTPADTLGDIDPKFSQSGALGETQWGFPDRIRALRRVLDAVYGVMPVVALYKRIPAHWSDDELEKKLKETGLGKVIVSYYPSADDPSDGSCEIQHAHSQVWVYGTPEPVGFDGEWDPLYSDTWPAFERQMLPMDPDRMVSREDTDNSTAVCSASFGSTLTTSATSTSSSPSVTTAPSSTKTPKITSCSLSTFTYPVSNAISTYTNCGCNDNQSGWPYSLTATDGARNEICFVEGQPIFTMNSIAPPTPTLAAPDITSCSLKKYTLTYSSTIDGTATALASQVNVCACNDGQEATPFTITGSYEHETIFCNKRPGGPTVIASVSTPGPPCSTPTTINTPFIFGKCTLNMTQKVDWVSISHFLVYAAWDGSAIPPNAPHRDHELSLQNLDDAVILSSCDTGFPFGVDIFLNERPSTAHRRDDIPINAMNSTTNGPSTPSLKISHEFWSWGIHIYAGKTSWVGFPNSKGPYELPYCKLGKWDPNYGGKVFRRAIDCHWGVRLRIFNAPGQPSGERVVMLWSRSS